MVPQKNKILVIISWIIPLIGLISLWVNKELKNDSFMLNHIQQILVLYFVILLVNILTLVSLLVPSIYVILSLLQALLSIYILVAFCTGLINALLGREFRLYLIGKLGDKITA